MTAGAPDPALLREALAAAGEPDPGADPAVAPLVGGASREAWRVDAGERRYVLRRDPPHETAPATSRRLEFAVTEAAHAAGVPVPRPVCFEPAGGRFGTAGMLCEFVDGTASPRRILAGVGEAGGALLAQIGHALGRLRTAPAATAGEPPADPALAMIERTERELDALGERRPAFELALRWLRLNLPEPRPPVIVHGDFRLGNFLVGERGLHAVVDWEFTHAGDEAEDAAFLCLRPWRFGRDDRRAAGLGDLDALLEAVERAAGSAPSRERVAYWEVLAQVGWGAYCLRQAHGWRDGTHRSLERLLIGRRAAEVEWDLLDLLEAAA